MKKNPAIDIPLWVLVIFGFLAALKVSIANYSGVVCPHFFSIPICYVVVIAYGLMLGSLIVNHNGCKHYSFCIGWGIAFLIALLASLAELFGSGGICPSTSGGGIRAASQGGVPLCYISLLILIAILVLFVKGPYRRICNTG